jgi:hypothetical protein
VAPWLSATIDGNPIRVGGLHLVADGMWIRPRQDVHAQVPTSRYQRSEGIGTAQPGAAMVKRHLRRVVSDNAAGAERGGVGVKAAEVIDPELRIETARIVFNQRQLHPTHRTIEPTLQSAGGGARTLDKRRSAGLAGLEPERGERGCAGGNLQEVPAGDRIWHERMPPSRHHVASAFRRKKDDRRVQYILRPSKRRARDYIRQSS